MASEPRVPREPTEPPKTEGERKLRDWMRDENVGPTELAGAIDVSVAAVYAFRSGEYRPKIEAREKLERYSAGRIPADDWKTDEERAQIENVQPREARDEPSRS